MWKACKSIFILYFGACGLVFCAKRIAQRLDRVGTRPEGSQSNARDFPKRAEPGRIDREESAVSPPDCRRGRIWGGIWEHRAGRRLCGGTTIQAKRALEWTRHGRSGSSGLHQRVVSRPIRCLTAASVRRPGVYLISARLIGTSRKCRTTAPGRSRARPGAAITGWKTRTWNCVRGFGSTRACVPA